MTAGRFLRDLVVALGAATACVLAVTRWALVPWAVEGRSMEPTMRDGDLVIVDLWTLRHRGPQAGDIVVVLGPGGEELVKRIARDPYPGPDTYPPMVLQPDSALEPAYAVLGDNPEESVDSRTFGRVPAHYLRGRVVWRYWPLSRWGPIE